MERCMSVKTGICKCSILNERRTRKSKRLYRIIEDLGYKTLGSII